MRHSHRKMPLHHIEQWTGSFFRAACLWEVGNYILVPHYSSRGRLCNELAFQKETLELYQQEKDQAEQSLLLRVALGAASGAASGAAFVAQNAAPEWEGLCEREGEDESEAETAEELDEDFDEDIRVSAGYLDLQGSPTENCLADTKLPQGAGEGATNVDPPGRDSLNNAYVRIIHLNGVHHLALVTCTCLSADNNHANLLSCRLIPTTFTRYRTLFTAGVLDDFRISNLECKVSAYQYYNKLRQLTSPAAPATVPSFYNELLRLSRLWRWMKKLKWAGYGHKMGDPDSADPNSPKSGELANFCPACPQPGINLPSNWKDDPNRYRNSVHTRYKGLY